MHQEGWYAKAFKKRLFTLGVPYLLFNILFVLEHVLIQNVGSHFGPATPLVLDFRFLLNCLGVPFLAHPYLEVTWYLRCLLLFVIVSPILKGLLGKDGRRSVPVCGGLVLIGLTLVPLSESGMFPTPPHGGWYFLWDAFGFSCFSIGVACRLRGCCVPTRPQYGLGVVAMAGAIMVQYFILPLNLLGAFGFSVQRGLVYPLAFLGVWSLVSDHLWPRLQGFSMPVYLLHEFVLYPIVVVVKILKLDSWLMSTSGFLVSGFVAIVCVVFFVIVLRRSFPRVLAFSLGGR